MLTTAIEVAAEEAAVIVMEEEVIWAVEDQIEQLEIGGLVQEPMISMTEVNNVNSCYYCFSNFV